MAVIPEKRLRVEFLYVAVFTTVTVMLWVGLELIRSLTAPAKISQVSKEELAPLSTELRLETTERLRSRTQISQDVLDKVEVKLKVTTATESASINTEPTEEEATNSGGF